MRKILSGLMLVLLTVSCGDSSGGHQHDGGGGGAAHVPAEGFGTAGDPDEADQTVEVSAMDALEFAPDEVEVEVGETVTFEVTNEGSTAHEFVLGDEAYQKAHGPGMEGMAHEDGNGVSLEPGASDTVTWTFSEAGEVLYACHINGHYEAGMVGRITVR